MIALEYLLKGSIRYTISINNNNDLFYIKKIDISCSLN